MIYLSTCNYRAPFTSRLIVFGSATQICPSCSVRTQLRHFSLTIRIPSILSHVTQPKVPNNRTNPSEVKEKEHHSKLTGAISNSIVSIGDIFKEIRDGSKSVRFPEKLLKVLEQKLQNIAMGKDPASVDSWLSLRDYMLTLGWQVL